MGVSFHYFECQLGNHKIEISSEVILCASLIGSIQAVEAGSVCPRINRQ